MKMKKGRDVDVMEHATVTCIPDEQFQHLRGHYPYISHRIQAVMDLLSERRYEGGKTTEHGHKRPDERSVFTVEEITTMLSCLEDLQYRLKDVFVKKEQPLHLRKKKNMPVDDV